MGKKGNASFRLDKILFLDIETVSEYRNYAALPEKTKYFWKRKARTILGKRMEDLQVDDVSPLYSERSGIYAEFAKIICISVGYFKLKKDESQELRLKSFFGKDESELLKNFSNLLSKHFDDRNKVAICGHNIKEFDVPFLCRRLLLNGMPFPNILDVQGLKPWETGHLIDTMELWKFGDRKQYTSLDHLAHIFQIPSSKDDIDGGLVGRVFWEENDLKRIVEYCEKDVRTTALLWRKLSGIDLKKR